jgi:PhoH-like ATPase
MKQQKKIFVLDTSVILFDHQAVMNFEEHNIAIPIQVLEELDTFKKGNDTMNFEARSFIRFLNEIVQEHLVSDWVPLNGKTKGKIKVVLDSSGSKAYDAEKIFDDHKNDHKIINAALVLKNENPAAKVILVSKDICLRLKAKSLDIFAEDYETGKIKDLESLNTSMTNLEVRSSLIDELFEKGILAISKLRIKESIANHYYILKHGKKSILSYYNPETAYLERVEKRGVNNIKPRNAEQTFAIHALLNPNIKLITLRGIAGTGKTLLALASALEQRRNYQQIYVTRPIVPLGNKDIGFLPGDIKSKVDPYMQPIWDNLKYIKSLYDSKDSEYKRIDEMVDNEKIAIAPLAYIRGRTLSNVFFIVDEAQNLTPLEVKTIVSRAGENTKIVFTGDIYQIDTPYLDSESNGLSYIIDRVKNHNLFAHVTLVKGERSELANLANDLL